MCIYTRTHERSHSLIVDHMMMTLDAKTMRRMILSVLSISIWCDIGVHSVTSLCGGCAYNLPCPYANGHPTYPTKQLCLTTGRCQAVCIGRESDADYIADCDTMQCLSAFQSDPDNCGSRGNVCPGIEFGTRQCIDFHCFTACNSGYTKGSVPMPFTNQMKDVCYIQGPDSCGSPSNICQYAAYGSRSCVSGSCMITCDSGYTKIRSTNPNNGQPWDYCYKIDNDICGIPHEKCVSPANGVSSCTSYVGCELKCNTGYTAYNGKCIDTTSDLNNCGRVNNICTIVTNGTQSCSNGQCLTTCNQGYRKCGEACLPINVDNCVGCGIKCADVVGATKRCTQQTCQYECESGLTQSATRCYNASSIETCGPSMTKCTGPSNSDVYCRSGQCGFTCKSPNYTLYNGTCANMLTDPNNCGSAGNVCITYQSTVTTCEVGVCKLKCAAGLTLVDNRRCVNLMIDVDNCGYLGNVCTKPNNSTSNCTSGICSFSCNTGFVRKDSSCISLTTDVNNCGSIGNVCVPNRNFRSICKNGE
jgi:hypothetical protein